MEFLLSMTQPGSGGGNPTAAASPQQVAPLGAEAKGTKPITLTRRIHVQINGSLQDFAQVLLAHTC